MLALDKELWAETSAPLPTPANLPKTYLSMVGTTTLM